jgi:hypothetical protein
MQAITSILVSSMYLNLHKDVTWVRKIHNASEVYHYILLKTSFFCKLPLLIYIAVFDTFLILMISFGILTFLNSVLLSTVRLLLTTPVVRGQRHCPFCPHNKTY